MHKKSNMNLEEALTALKAGKKVYRLTWNEMGLNRYLKLETHDSNKMTITRNRYREPFIFLYVEKSEKEEKDYGTWCPQYSDMIASDYRVVVDK